MRTLTQQLDRRSCKITLRGVAGTPRSSSSSSSRPPRQLRGSIVTVLILVFFSCSPSRRFLSTRSSFLLESGTSAYFLDTYDRPRVVLFCLAAWAGSGDLEAISVRRLLSFLVLFLLQLRDASLAFELSQNYFSAESMKFYDNPAYTKIERAVGDIWSHRETKEGVLLSEIISRNKATSSSASSSSSSTSEYFNTRGLTLSKRARKSLALGVNK